ncbi:MAG TPA: hypothetical protein V6D47_15270 [Oscillatoriaceae cyanobacterium]
MSKINLDMKLVAQGYDANKNGRVDDDLNVGNTGIKTVDDLANALSNDKVVITNGAVVAKAPGDAPTLADVNDMQHVHEITGQALTWGGPEYPGYQYQTTKYDSNNQPYTSYNWGSAIQDIRARLDSVSTITEGSNDSASRSIHQIANTALEQNNWEYYLDEGTSHSRYIALYTALQNINQISDAPAQPGVTDKNVNDSVNSAEKALNDLKTTLGASSTKAITDAQVNAKVSDLRKAASSIPWWHYLLLFGFFQKHGDNSTADRLTQDLATLRSANPDAIGQPLPGLAKQAYDINTQSWNAKNLNDASTLQQNAQPVVKGANGVQSKANDTNNQVNDLSKTLAGK